MKIKNNNHYVLLKHVIQTRCFLIPNILQVSFKLQEPEPKAFGSDKGKRRGKRYRRPSCCCVMQKNCNTEKKR